MLLLDAATGERERRMRQQRKGEPAAAVADMPSPAQLVQCRIGNHPHFSHKLWVTVGKSKQEVWL